MAIELPFSSSSSSLNPQWTYDVFLSFRGEDTRRGFTDHLYSTLTRQGIYTFRDDEELERGKPISPKLLEAIQDSRIALVVFSKQYASSPWCLDELTRIVECMEEMEQRVFPIFYDVDPSDVRRQTGPFTQAFVTHEERIKDGLQIEKVQRWRAALTQVANLSGFHLQQKHESVFIDEILESTLNALHGATFSSPLNDIGPMGISYRLSEIMNLCLGTATGNNVVFMGIWGMSGIGKTTLARALYEKIAGQFQGSCFLENVREVSSKIDGIATLQQKMLTDFQMKINTKKRDVHDVVKEIKQRLRHKKVLMILDDVNELKQLEKLAGSSNWFGHGSRIIITTKDEQLLISHGVAIRYKAKEMNDYEALKLFSWKVFKNDRPPQEYMKLSFDFVCYAKGLPLAIEVLGSFLCGRSISEWESAFRRLKKSPDGKIMSALLIGFDGLHEEEKQIFLDIACFFRGKDKGHVTKILESFGFEAVIGISVLIGKSLITILGSKLWMHDMLQEMGWRIVCQENSEPGNRSRLWKPADVSDVLKYNTGTDTIEGLVVRLPHEMKLASNAFRKMRKLRFLEVSNVLLPQGLNCLSSHLQVLEWPGYPSKLLPESFPSDKLVHISMFCSHIEYLWKGYKDLNKLKSIDLKDSASLIATPNFSGVPNLEKLILEGCTKLSNVHPSIGNLKHLILLNMKNCKRLTILSCDISLESLKVLNLSGCERLERFPKIVGDMQSLSKLYLDETAIKELPTSAEHLTGLTLLDLSHCTNLSSLPSGISNLTRLKTIILSGCSRLVEIPENIGNVECLEELDLSGTAIRHIPSSISYLRNLKKISCSGCNFELSSSLLRPSFQSAHPLLDLLSPLKSLVLRYCNLVDGAIPNDLDHLPSLTHLNLGGNNFTSIPQSISRLSKLERLGLNNCCKLQSLPKLPSSVQLVGVDACSSLKNDSHQYEVWSSNKKGYVFITKHSVSRTCFVEMSITQFAAWLQQYHEVQVGLSQPLRTAYGLATRANKVPNWFSNRSSSFSVTNLLPTDLHNKRRSWIGYALYVGIKVHEEFDVSGEFKVRHQFDCYFGPPEDPRDKQTLYHEATVTDIPFTGKHGYWTCIPHLWFSKLLNNLNECNGIEVHTMIDSPHVNVEMSGGRLLYEQDFTGFVQAVTSNHLAVRVNKSENSVLLAEAEVCNIDTTLPLKEHLESLPSDVKCFERRNIRQDNYSYTICGKFAHPFTAFVLRQILQEYSKHDLNYYGTFPQCEIPGWFCSSIGSTAIIPLNVRLDCMEGWKGLAICASFSVPRDSLIRENLGSQSPKFACHLKIGKWDVPMSGVDISDVLASLKSPGFISIWYASRGAFPEVLLNDCTSMQVTFRGNCSDITVHSCGYQILFHENVTDCMETILQCSTASQFQPSKDDGANSSPAPTNTERQSTISNRKIFLYISFSFFIFSCWIIRVFIMRKFVNQREWSTSHYCTDLVPT